MKKNGQKNELNNNKKRKKTKKNEKNAGKLANARKLAFYIGSLDKGGAERVFVNLAEYFQSRGYHIVMVTQYRKAEEYALADGIKRVISDITPQETTGSRLVNFWRRVRKLHRIWKEEMPDLV